MLLYRCRGFVNIMRNKLFVLLLLGALAVTIFGMESVEAKKSSKGGAIAQADMDAMSLTVDTLTKKMYAKGLFSPEDNANLIDIKLKLDNQMLIASDPTLAPLYYKNRNSFEIERYER